MWTSANSKEEYIVKLKLDGLLDIEADEGKKQLKLNVDKEALCRAEELDGCYALKTDLPREVASKETIHDRYKGLSEVEWAFRTQSPSCNTSLETGSLGMGTYRYFGLERLEIVKETIFDIVHSRCGLCLCGV